VPVRAHLHTGSEIDAEWAGEGLHPYQRQELANIKALLGPEFKKYLTISPGKLPDMGALFRSSRVVTMTALCEGRNRSIHEAMSCGVPVVTFEDFNKYSRGLSTVFPNEGGLRAPKFTAESLAATLLEVLDSPPGRFTPREAVLRESGRRAVSQTVVDSFAEYYSKALPGYAKGQPIEQNAWVQEHMAACYQVSLEEWWFTILSVVGKPRFHAKGLKDCQGIFEVYSKLNDKLVAGTPVADVVSSIESITPP